MRMISRFIGALVLVALAGCCAFGFLASYEYPEIARRLPWQLGYGAIGIFCLVGATTLVRPRRGITSKDSPGPR